MLLSRNEISTSVGKLGAAQDIPDGYDTYQVADSSSQCLLARLAVFQGEGLPTAVTYLEDPTAACHTGNGTSGFLLTLSVQDIPPLELFSLSSSQRVPLQRQQL